MKTWDNKKVKKELFEAFKKNSEIKLLKVLKENSFLFYELYHRKNGIQPNFCEVSFGGKFKCDFAWLNDNSDGPEWVLVEVEKPNLKIFKKNNTPTVYLNSAIEQVKAWDRYFIENPSEKRRIFGVVEKFRFILVGGNGNAWKQREAFKWRTYNNSNSNIEIRTSDVFIRALNILEKNPEALWGFTENPKSLNYSKLEEYQTNNQYLTRMKNIF
jgi:Shedu protein SduA, C-terminal